MTMEDKEVRIMKLFPNSRFGLLSRVFATVMLSAFCFAHFAAAANQATNFCTKTAADALRSCDLAAQSDFSLAIARCDNLATPDSGCNRQAAAEREDALQSCQEQSAVRRDACQKLGPAPYAPEINPANFVTHIDNSYFPLTPGTTFVYEGQTEEGLEHDEFAVTHRTRVIQGVRCVEVHDTVHLDGILTEDTRDWFAQDVEGNVWYFGENTHELEGGLITTIDGTFEAGVDQAKPGIIMEAHRAMGDFYRQEFDLANAEDFAEVTGLNATVTIPLGVYHQCLKTSETTPLEPDLLEEKYYCPGVGNVLTVDRVTGDRVPLIRIDHE